MIYFLCADLGGSYCIRYANSESEAKQVVASWLTSQGFTGPIPASVIQVFKIPKEMQKESILHQLENGLKVNFKIAGINIEFRKGM